MVSLLEIVGLSRPRPCVRPYTQRIRDLWSGLEMHYTQTEGTVGSPLDLQTISTGQVSALSF